jgi:hypothetical protein
VVGILLERPLVEDPAAHLAWAHALVRDWFLAKFGSPTEPQIEGWPPILAGKDTLISAPTGSGKILAAFLACIDRLVRKALDGRLEDCTEVLYISPLKALGNDIQKNLEVPLSEIQALAGERGLLMPPLRAAVRTGDTLMHERRALLKKPPHILVTTPESLYILLTTESGVRALRHVETVIVDEIHAIADDKRGAHLALSLERLVHTTRIAGGPVRIGLSATQRPIELVAGFLTGSARPNPVIVDTGHRRKFDLAVEIPASAWERQILARRVRDYDPAALDRLCLTGAVGWGRLSPHPATLDNSGTQPGASADGVIDGDEGKRSRRVVPTSVAPITFFLREECDWMQSRHDGDDAELSARGLSAVAREVLEFLRRRGASFFADIVRGTGKLKAEVETGLWELVAAGRVTADGFDNLRALIDPRRRAGHGNGRTARPRHATGRWSLLYAGEPAERNRQVEATCWMLLHRYGVVFRELLARETGLPRWRELQVALRRLEDRGEIRGGRFIAGFIGEQFALPVAVESLRELRRLELSQGEHAAPELITISAADPLNMVGIVVPGERIPAISGRHLTLRNGIPGEERQPAPVPIREAAM